MTTELREAIARLRKASGIPYSIMKACDPDDLMLVCDALEASEYETKRLAEARSQQPDWERLWEESQLALVRCQSKLSTTLQRLEKKRPPKFDKVAYQREYMRRRRAEEKHK
jgi:hypothetical protein